MTPYTLAKHQLDLDARATQRVHQLFARKLDRMRASPFAFLRGSAELFFEVLRERPDLRARGPGVGFILGDAHMENFGAFHGRGTERPVFDVNDFDESVVAPLWLDALRFTTSVLLASRELGMTGPEAMDTARELTATWEQHARGEGRVPREPREVTRLLSIVAKRSARDLLHGRVQRDRFVRGERYLDLPRKLHKGAKDAFERYLGSLDDDERIHDDRAEVLDVAWRVAGTGSLGKVRVAVLAAGKHQPWIFDLKEQGEAAPAAFALEKKKSKKKKKKKRKKDPTKIPAPAARVLAGARAMLERPPYDLGWTTLAGLPMVGRRLSPIEDKLDLTQVRPEEIGELVVYLAALLGRAHRRGAIEPVKAWSPRERERLVESAVTLAGMHESAYLAYCALAPQP